MTTETPKATQATDVQPPAELSADEIAQVSGGNGQFAKTGLGTARPKTSAPDFRSAH